MKKRKTNAALRAVIAVAAAVILLAVTGFGAFRLMGGPDPVTQGAELRNGAYISADLTYIMDVIGVERSGDSVKAYYAVAPIGDQFVMIRFPASDSESMMALEDATDAYLTGQSPTLPYRLGITGAARNMDEGTAALLAQWFSDNAGWMSQAGVISAIENYGDYLSGVMIDTAGIGNVSVTFAVAAAVLAGLLLVYAVAEFTLIGTGFYAKPRRSDADA